MVPIKYKRLIKECATMLHHFGVRMAWSHALLILHEHDHGCRLQKEQEILRYLKKHYCHVLAKYAGATEPAAPAASDAPIWVLWWDGDMPPILQLCHQSKIRAAGNHPVVLLNKDNIHQYVQFPENVWKQFKEKRLRIQHLADMIRVQLIRRHGGIWLDASIFCQAAIPDSFFSFPLFSLKNKSDDQYISRNRWTTFTIGGCRQNVLCSFLDDFFQEYCNNSKPFIDYFMFDYAIALAYQELPAVQASIDALPMNEQDIYWLTGHLKDRADEALLQDYHRHAALFSKLAWRAFEGEAASGSLWDVLSKEYRV